MRLLYIDDDRINSLLFEEACRMAGGIRCDTAADGAEAVEAAERLRPAVLVIDLHLPDTDGYALLQRLRGIDGLANVPAYLCTAEEPSAVQAPAAAAGFLDCWTKPIDIGRLIEALNALRGTP
jgi:two-component system, OmpR family, response regulator